MAKMKGDNGGNKSIKDECDAFVASAKVAVVAKSWCPYCTKAVKLLNGIVNDKQDIKVWNIDGEAANKTSDIQAYMKKITGASSVPRVFINGKILGGCDDTVALNKKGKLKSLIYAKI